MVIQCTSSARSRHPAGAPGSRRKQGRKEVLPAGIEPCYNSKFAQAGPFDSLMGYITPWEKGRQQGYKVAVVNWIMIRAHILQVEDEPGDVLEPRRAIEKARPGCHFHWVRNGDQAIDYLSGAGAYADRSTHPFPCLVLLDLSLPGVDGFDLLAWVAAHPQWRSLPFIVLSGSNNPEDERHALKLGALAYYVKRPDDYSLLAQHVARLLPPPVRMPTGVIQAAAAHRRVRQTRL